MEIRTKQIYDEQLKQQIFYSFTLLISYMVFNPFKMWSSSLRLHQVFPIFMVQMLFIINSTGPWPHLQKVRKIPDKGYLDCSKVHVTKYFRHIFNP